MCGVNWSTGAKPPSTSPISPHQPPSSDSEYNQDDRKDSSPTPTPVNPSIHLEYSFIIIEQGSHSVNPFPLINTHLILFFLRVMELVHVSDCGGSLILSGRVADLKHCVQSVIGSRNGLAPQDFPMLIERIGSIKRRHEKLGKLEYNIHIPD
jgi:hypothetical protein